MVLIYVLVFAFVQGFCKVEEILFCMVKQAK